MLSRSLNNKIVVGTGCLITGIMLIFIPESKSFGAFLIGVSIGLGLSIIEKIRKTKGS